MAAKTDWMKTIVGLTFVWVFCYTAVRILNYAIPETNREIAHFMMGEIAGVALTIASFYFGSSKGSQEKQRTIDKITDDKINS